MWEGENRFFKYVLYAEATIFRCMPVQFASPTRAPPLSLTHPISLTLPTSHPRFRLCPSVTQVEYGSCDFRCNGCSSAPPSPCSRAPGMNADPLMNAAPFLLGVCSLSLPSILATIPPFSFSVDRHCLARLCIEYPVQHTASVPIKQSTTLFSQSREGAWRPLGL